MVSFHASLLPTSTMIQDCDEDSSNKRKREGSLQIQDFLDDRDHPLSKNKYSKSSVLDTELHLETPMPSEWQRCLDIKSGQIYYHNTKTHTKTLIDPISSSMKRPEHKVYSHTQTKLDIHEPPKNMSLDLELNLPCGSSSHTTKKHHVADNFSKYKTSSTRGGGGGDGSGVRGPPSWLALEGGDQQQEMMTAVCKKCHMLVMMFKTSPSCPNCKFMHPPNQTPPSLFNNRELSLLC